MRVLAFSLILATAGCGGETSTAPSTTEAQGVQFSLHVVRHGTLFEDKITIMAVAENHGPSTVTRGEGCGFWIHGMQLAFIGPDEQRSHPSNQLFCRGPSRTVEMKPGDRLVATADFDGFLYGIRITPVEAPTGEYFAVGSFSWCEGVPPDRECHEVESRVSFKWDPR